MSDLHQNSTLKLNAVYAVKERSEAGVYLVECNITDAAGETYDGVSVVRPDDPYGLNPVLREWLAANPDFPITPYTPPSPEELRASLPPLTARQLRLGLLSAGISPSQVDTAIGAMPAGQDRDRALIEWEYANSFNRAHPLLAVVGSSLNLTDEQIDAMWSAALSL